MLLNLIPNTRYAGEEITKNIEKKVQFDKKRTVEILCPFTGQQLSSSKCMKCAYCQVNKGKHQSNRTLVSLICLYGHDNGSDENEL